MLKAVNMFMGLLFFRLYGVRTVSVQGACYLCAVFRRHFNLNLTVCKFSDRCSGLSFQNLHWMPVMVTVRCRNTVLAPYSEEAFTARICNRIAFLSPCLLFSTRYLHQNICAWFEILTAVCCCVYLPCHLHAHPIESPLTCQDFRQMDWTDVCVRVCARARVCIICLNGNIF